jgi:hypothetical protein
VWDGVVHGAFLFGGGSLFYALAFAISTIVEAFWAPALAMLGIASVITFARAVNPALSGYTLAPILTAEGHFNGTGLPWMGLAIVLALSAGLFFLSARNVARRDF